MTYCVFSNPSSLQVRWADYSDLPPFVTPQPTKLTPALSGAGCDGG